MLLDMADAGPEIGNGLFEPAEDCDGGIGFFGNGVRGVESCDFLDGSEGVSNVRGEFADDDESLSVPVTGPPEPKFVVASDDFEVWFGLIEEPDGG